MGVCFGLENRMIGLVSRKDDQMCVITTGFTTWHGRNDAVPLWAAAKGAFDPRLTHMQDSEYAQPHRGFTVNEHVYDFVNKLQMHSV